MNVFSILQAILNGAGLHVDVQTFLLVFGLILSRVASAVALIPFVGGPSVPGQIKIGFAALVSLVLFPSLLVAGDALPRSPLVYMALLIKEVVVGAIIGFSTQLVFYGVQIAGTIIDTQRGMNQITYLAPQLPGHVSALGNLKFQASLVLFLSLGGHLAFLRGLAKSFAVVPLSEMPHMQGGWVAVADHIARISANALAIGLQLSAPIVLAIFLVDVSFGCIGKVASQIRISNDANTAKSWIGLAVLFFGAAFLLGQLHHFFLFMLRSIEEITKVLA